MRPCQVCGCASWGPIGNASELKRLEEFLPNAKGYDFVRCDNCKAIARADLLQESAPTPDPAPDAGFPGIVSDLFKHVMPTVPEPPTRTERLVVALLRSGMFAAIDMRSLMEVLKNPEGELAVIAIARAIERQLDAPVTATPDPFAKQPWLVLSFSEQKKFEKWCEDLWKFINERDGGDFTTVTAFYPRQWFDAAVEFVKGKQHATQS